MQEGLRAIRAAGMEMRRPLYLALLAEGTALAGRAETGRKIVAQALAQIERTGERWSEAEQYLLDAELGCADDPPPSEGRLLEAIELARAQGGRSWELRSSLGLARRWLTRAKRREALALLEPIYQRFSEGFGTSDVRQAGAVLDRSDETT